MSALPRLCWLVPEPSVPPDSVHRWEHRLASGVLVGNRWKIERYFTSTLVDPAEFEALAVLLPPSVYPPTLVPLALAFIRQQKPIVELGWHGLAVRLCESWPPPLGLLN